jgi:hypothetical protein
MEAWKHIPHFETVQPVFALSITTERWGFERFPPNIIVTPADWNTAVHSNSTTQAWTQPYSCHHSISNSSTYNVTSYDLEYNHYKDTLANVSSDHAGGLHYANDRPSLDHNIIAISQNLNICTKPQACPLSECQILIPGALKKRIGAKGANIVPLAHGISAFFSILVLVIMGVFSFLGRRKAKANTEKEYPKARPKVVPVAETRGPHYNPRRPVDGQRPIPPPTQAPTKINMANEVAKCSALLREMYALDLIIYGMEKNVDEEAPERIQKQIKANAIFAEIGRMVNGWKATDGAGWKPQEREFIEEICKVVKESQGRIYPEEVYEPRSGY